MRKRESQEEFSSCGGDRSSNAQRGVDTQAQLDQSQGDTDKASELGKGCKDITHPRDMSDNYRRRLNRRWENQGGEFP
jgi:hypothetical protein